MLFVYRLLDYFKTQSSNYKFLNNSLRLNNIEETDLIILTDGKNIKGIKKIIKKNIHNKILIIIKNEKNHKKFINFINSYSSKYINFKLFSWRLFGTYENSWESHSLAYKMVDEASSKFICDYKKLYSFILNLYKNEKIEYALKKFLLKNIYYSIDIFLAYKKIFSLNKNVICIFNDIEKNYIKKIPFYNSEKSSFFETLHTKNYYFKNILENFFLNIVFLFYPIYSLLSIRKITLKKREFKLGVRLYGDGLNFNKNDYHIDWMVDQKFFKSDNVLFIAEDNLKKVIKIQIDKNKYFHTSVSYLKPTSTISLKQIFKNLFVNPFHSLMIIWRFNRTNQKYFFLNAWINYIQWSSFNDTFNLKSFICYHSYNEKQIFRNIFLENNNCKTYLYKHTHSETVFNSNKRNEYYNVFFGYNFYHKEFHWSNESIDMALKNNSKSNYFLSTGPIWSSKELKFKNKIFKKFNKKDKNVALFSSSYDRAGCVNDLSAHIKFLNFIYIISNKYSDMNFYFKPKYEFKYNFPESKELSILASKLYKQKNLFIVKDVAPIFLIKNCTISISMPFSSPVVEAIACYNKAYYADLTNAYPYSFFNKIDNLVANSEKDAIRLFDYWLNTENKDFIKFIDKKVKNFFGDNFGDNSASIIKKQMLDNHE